MIGPVALLFKSIIFDGVYIDVYLLCSKYGMVIIVFPGRKGFFGVLSIMLKWSHKMIVFSSLQSKVGFSSMRYKRAIQCWWIMSMIKFIVRRKEPMLWERDALELQLFSYGKIRQKLLSSESSIYSNETVLAPRSSLLLLQKMLQWMI